MPSAVPLRTDFSAGELRQLAKRSKDNNQSRRLLSLAAVADGMNRTDAARIGGMDRQTLRDWFIASTKPAPTGYWTTGPADLLPGCRQTSRPNSRQCLPSAPLRPIEGLHEGRISGSS